MNDPKQKLAKHYFYVEAPEGIETGAILLRLGKELREQGSSLVVHMGRYAPGDLAMSRDSDGNQVADDPAAVAGFEQGSEYRQRQLESRGLK
jgi:hypothetical protein